MVIATLVRELKKYMRTEEIQEIKDAYRFAAAAHAIEDRTKKWIPW